MGRERERKKLEEMWERCNNLKGSFLIVCVSSCRQTAGPDLSRPEEAQSKGPEEDPGGVGRVLQRLCWKIRLYPQNHRAHAQVRPCSRQSTDRTVERTKRHSTLDWTWIRLWSREEEDQERRRKGLCFVFFFKAYAHRTIPHWSKSHTLLEHRYSSCGFTVKEDFTHWWKGIRVEGEGFSVPVMKHFTVCGINKWLGYILPYKPFVQVSAQSALHKLSFNSSAASADATWWDVEFTESHCVFKDVCVALTFTWISTAPTVSACNRTDTHIKADHPELRGCWKDPQLP